MRNISRTLMAIAGLSLCAAIATAGGCAAGPNQANIQLRKQIDQLNGQITELKAQHNADAASIRGLQAKIGTIPTLPQDRLDQLYTTCDIQLGRLTGGYRPDMNVPGDTMLKVYAVPVDAQGDVLKSAGSFSIEAFDLALPKEQRIGHWDFNLQQSHDLFFGKGFLYTYVLDCPWQTKPIHVKLTVRVTFTDALTERVFTVDKDMDISLPK